MKHIEIQYIYCSINYLLFNKLFFSLANACSDHLETTLPYISCFVEFGFYLPMCFNPFQINGIVHKATYNKVRMVHSIY